MTTDPDFEAMLDTIEYLLPEHSLACCVREGIYWVMDDSGHPVVTNESCQCRARVKNMRALLNRHRRSPKGFHPRYPDKP